MDADEKRRKHTEYMRGWRARNPDAVKTYHARRSATDPEYMERARQRAAEWYANNKERALETSRRRNAALPKKGRPSGDAVHNWKGDNVSYGALHRWVVRHKGNARKCEHCGTETAKAYDWANVDHQYRRVLDDWIRLCRTCHRQHDYGNGLSKKRGPKAI